MRKLIERCVPLFMFSLLFQSIGAQAETCEETLKLVQQMYNLETDACGPDAASDCSGLLIRGTHRADPAKGQKWDVWNPSPKALELKSTAFSYFRKDIRYDDPGMKTQNGFITTPFDYLCAGQKGGHLQCAFPTDGWTDNRVSGCGDSKATAQIERACQDMNINSGAAWFADFNRHDANANFAHSIAEQSQCGFGMEQARGREGRKLAFKNFLDARKTVNEREFTTQTEVRLSNPGTDQMPVLAFFSSDSRGDADARANQIDYLRKTGNYRPIINIKFPVSPGDVATFSCAPNQAVPPAMNSSPGFCIAGKAPSPGFGSTTGTGANPAQYEAVANQFVNQTQAAAAAAAAAQAQKENGFCKTPYIAKSEWIQRDDPVLGKNTWSLSVTPTECGRKIGPAETDRMYAELYNKHSKDPQWAAYAENFNSMRRQLVCHLEATRGKIEWNLEPARPYVSQAAAIASPSACNPVPKAK